MKAHGPQEDRAYLLNQHIQKNVRRGNTIMETTDGQLQIVRKGLTKFYDIKIEFVNQHRYNEGLFAQDGGVYGQQERNMRDYTLGGVFE